MGIVVSLSEVQHSVHVQEKYHADRFFRERGQIYFWKNKSVPFSAISGVGTSLGLCGTASGLRTLFGKILSPKGDAIELPNYEHPQRT
jgi:hypothetical protein